MCSALCVCAVGAGAGVEAAFAQTCLNFEVLLYNGSLTTRGARLPGDGRVCQTARSTSILFRTGIPGWKQCSNFSSLMMRVSPPCALRQQTKAGNSGEARKDTCCWLACAALGSERALLHTGGSAVPPRKGSPPFLLCLPPPKASCCC